MKHYANILLAVLLTASLSTANTTSQAEYTFTIHVGAFVKAKLTDFENIRSYGYLYAQKFSNLQQVYMGDYPSEGAAAKVLKQIKASGYPDAFITRRSLETGYATSVIQLGSEKVGANINWDQYASAGPLQTYQSGDKIQIITGPFETLDEAQSRLSLIKKIGFGDAFIKNVNDVLLHKVTAFETGGRTQIPDNFEEIVVLEEPETEVIIAEIPPKKKSVPNVMIKKKAKVKKTSPKEEPRPTTYGDVVTAKSPTTAPVSIPKPKEAAPAPAPKKEKVTTVAKAKKKKAVDNTLALPYIRPKVKRTSVLKLQEVLKIKGTYKSSLDGFYGGGTKKAYQEILANNKEIQKYKLLAEMYKTDSEKESGLQEAVYGMGQDVAINVSKLQGYKSALSKAYQAYGIYVLSGKNKKTDELMNKAIKASFSNKKLKNKPPFDYKAAYSYSDYGQLIKHIRYIHGASQEKVNVPCWLFEKHSKEAMAAFDPTNDLVSGDYMIQDCGNIMNWESLNLLDVVMKEMTPDLSNLDKKELAKFQSKRAALLLNPIAQSVEDYKKIDTWNTNLWAGLTKWEMTDPLHGKMTTPLKVAYFQSWALLEDHFMNKGLKAKEARGVSLAVLQTIVEPYLARYSD